MDVSISEYNGTQALRIAAHNVEQQTPTHFVLLLDTSDSMNENNKLEHVKFCASLMLKLMTPADKLSLVTFGEQSRILLAAVPTDAAHCSSIAETISTLSTDGCTNLSGGLASAAEVIAMDSERKPMLLLLTDGHANRGISKPDGLKQIIGRLQERFPALGFSVIGYGFDHNAELLKSFAEDLRGAYSIVQDLEGAAITIGEALGTAISCVAQNVEIHCAPGTTIEGPYTSVGGRIVVGDLYSGTESLYLLKTSGPVVVKGVTVPGMASFSIEATRVEAGRQADVELTSLRYDCSALFNRLSQCTHSIPSDLLMDIAAFKALLADPFLAGHAITRMLESECASLEAAVQAISHGRYQAVQAQVSQHAAFTSLGRGTSREITERSEEGPEDPSTALSPTRSVAQQRVASLMQTMSQAAEYSEA